MKKEMLSNINLIMLLILLFPLFVPLNDFLLNCYLVIDASAIVILMAINLVTGRKKIHNKSLPVAVFIWSIINLFLMVRLAGSLLAVADFDQQKIYVIKFGKELGGKNLVIGFIISVMMVIIACKNAYTTKRIVTENLNIYLEVGNKEEIEYFSVLESSLKIVWSNLMATAIVSIFFL